MSTGPRNHDEPEEPRRRRFAAVGVAAAVLLAGGGAYWTSTALGGNDTGDAASAGSQDGGTPPLLTLDGYGKQDGEGAGSGSGQRYRAQGALPDGPESAPVYRSTASVDKETVAELAEALGIKGTTELEQGTWSVGDGRDGMGPALRVSAKEPGDWSYVRYAQNGDTPASSDAAETQEKPVSKERAEKEAAPVLKALGLDDAAVDANATVGALRTVQAEPRVGKLPIHGWKTGVTVGADGQLVRANGTAGQLTKGAQYPVLTAEEALGELNKSSPGAFDVRCVRAPCEPPEKSARLKVTDAEFGLAAHTSKGRRLLVPSWLFQVDRGPGKGLTVAYPAVEPRHLATQPGDGDGAEPGKPSAEPAEPDQPGQTEPGAVDQHVESYSSQGRELTLHFWGGVCSDSSASAEETEDTVKVEITATETKPGQVCIKIAKAMTLKVTLDQPVGDRTVVGADGQKLPEK